MAYKFQMGNAVLSGSLTQEGDIIAQSGGDASKGVVSASLGLRLPAAGTLIIGESVSLAQSDFFKIDGVTNGTVAAGKVLTADANKDFSGFRHISGSGNALFGGTVRFDGAVDTSMVIGDSLYFRDADGLMKREAASDVRDLYFSAVSGDATVAAGGALTIANDAVEQAMIADDAVGADQLAANAVVNASIASNAAIDMDKLDGGSLAAALTDLAQGDLLYAGDADASNALKSITFSNLEDAIFGNVGTDATIAAGGALTIANNAINNAKMADDSVGAAELIDDSVGAAAMADDAVGTAVIVDNAVTLAKMAGLTRGSIILGDSSGDPSALAKGSAATLLQSDGTDVSYVAMSGDATIAAGGALTIADNAVSLAKMAGLTRGSLIIGDASGDPSALAKGTAHQFLQSDGTDAAYVSMSGDATLAAGALTIADNAVTLAKMAGLAAGKLILGDGSGDPAAVTMSGDATLSNAGALTIAADAVEAGMLNDNVISGQTELAADGLAAADEFMVSDGGTLKKIGVDTLFTDGPGLLTAAAVAVDADHFMFLDGGATGDAKTESIVDLVAGIAGAGLSAASGQLSVQGNSVTAAVTNGGGTLSEGYNYFADITGSVVVKLPAGPTVGDVVTVKAKGGVTQSNKIAILKQGIHLIDGLGEASIESPYGALSFVYVAANDWRIV